MRIWEAKTRSILARTGTALALSTALGCASDPVDPVDPVGAVGAVGAVEAVGATEHYVVKGKVVNSAGKPVEGVKIVVRDQRYYDSNIVLHSDNNGTYHSRLPHEPSSWVASASVTCQYHGSQYTFDLEPSSTDSFRASAGAVRDFTWRITGKRPGADGRYYGGLVATNLWFDNVPEEVVDQDNVRLTMTPITPLIDGSTGKVISGRKPVYTDSGWAVVDVPLGRYKITATYNSPNSGKVYPLQVKQTGSPTFGSQVTSDFEQSGTNQRIRLEVKFA
ncbi:hypothetical protein IMZ11_32020 [Microtetraspora sp. AC03309]|uniref:hypothetical protein n=1 Tax=Microtetraspora sp. AC03309 TaxID=2779376 RepID=UPI001E2866AA|nr:hypothetical protein [Microtetraspora sp. AC03309]MCC5580258.1 hypothetical protein [Microtetraspora sp. AC03309]